MGVDIAGKYILEVAGKFAAESEWEISICQRTGVLALPSQSLSDRTTRIGDSEEPGLRFIGEDGHVSVSAFPQQL